MKKRLIALVCCRKNSKGIPNKNIKIFHGKPLLYWTFNNIKKSKIFDEIYLSTDGKNIFKVGSRLGFKIPHLRPKKLAKDNSDVFKTHNFFFKKMKIKDDNSLVCVINNNPFINFSLIRKSFKIFKKNKFTKIVMGALPVDSDQIFFRQMKKIKNYLIPKYKKELIKSKINRKDNKIYYNIGDLRWGKPSWLINYKNFNQRISRDGFNFFEINKNHYHDINVPYEWGEAIKKFKKL
jgi:N-acylneuraminate cytidylyltransferase